MSDAINPIAYGRSPLTGWYILYRNTSYELSKLTQLLISAIDKSTTMPVMPNLRIHPDGTLRAGGPPFLMHLPSFLEVFSSQLYSVCKQRFAYAPAKFVSLPGNVKLYRALPQDFPMGSTIPLPLGITAVVPPPASVSPPIVAPLKPAAPLKHDKVEPRLNDEIGMMQYDVQDLPPFSIVKNTLAPGVECVLHVVSLTKPWGIAMAYPGYFSVRIPGLPLILARTCPASYNMMAFQMDRRHNVAENPQGNIIKFIPCDYQNKHVFSIYCCGTKRYLVLDHFGKRKAAYVALEINNDSMDYLKEMFEGMAKLGDNKCTLTHLNESSVIFTYSRDAHAPCFQIYAMGVCTGFGDGTRADSTLVLLIQLRDIGTLISALEKTTENDSAFIHENLGLTVSSGIVIARELSTGLMLGCIRCNLIKIFIKWLGVLLKYEK